MRGACPGASLRHQPVRRENDAAETCPRRAYVYNIMLRPMLEEWRTWWGQCAFGNEGDMARQQRQPRTIKSFAGGQRIPRRRGAKGTTSTATTHDQVVRRGSAPLETKGTWRDSNSIWYRRGHGTTATANVHAQGARGFKILRLNPGPCVLRILESWVVLSTVRDLARRYVSLRTAVGGPTSNPRSSGPASCDESLAMRTWLRFGCGNLGLQVDCTVGRYIFSLKLKHGGSLNHPKGTREDGGRESRDDKTNMSPADLSAHTKTRVWAYVRASLHPRIPNCVL